MKMEQAGKKQIGSSRRPVLSQQEEFHLPKCIGSMCRFGFSPTREQIKGLVRDYVCIQELITPFKHGRPGKDWLKGFHGKKQPVT